MSVCEDSDQTGSLMCAQWFTKDFIREDRGYADQIELMPMVIEVFT